MAWAVSTSTCGLAFNTSQSWHSDFGNGEDYDQYKVGDFDGDGCDDVWLIRNDGAFNCTGGSNCAITISWLLSRRPNGDSCAVSGSTPDHFGTHGTQYSLPTSLVTDRAGTAAWAWVVGDFEPTNGLGCDDLAVGIGSQTDPRFFAWRMLRAHDSNSNGLCDTLVDDGQWRSDWGALGTHHVFAAEAGNGSAEDIIQVFLTVAAGGTSSQVAEWQVGYSNGSDALTDTHAALADHLVTGTETHWTGMVFGVGDFDTVNSNGVDFITLRGTDIPGAVRAKIAYRASGTGSWTLSTLGADAALPTPEAAWNQPTDDDDSVAKDNGGDDAKGMWWCQDDDVAYCSSCGGCCPVSCCSTQCGP